MKTEVALKVNGQVPTLFKMPSRVTQLKSIFVSPCGDDLQRKPGDCL